MMIGSRSSRRVPKTASRHLTVAAAMLVLACGSGERPTSERASGAPADAGVRPAVPGSTITGAGASFPNPIYTKWFDAYHRATGVQINYASIGSGGGIRQFTEGTVDFGATDGPMTDKQIQAANGNVLHTPTVLGAVVVTYNLPSIGKTSLRLDGPTVADIYLRRITRWNDRRIATLNPGVKLPDADILVVYRSEGSGTTFIFTDYLSKISADWKAKVGTATSVEWPGGIGGRGNEGVTQQVKQTEGAIGYVELIYAIANGLPYATVKNAAGNFVEPNLESVAAAAAGTAFGADTDFRVSITNAPGAEAYPISSFTWLLLRKQPRDSAKAAQIREFVRWMLTPEAQQMAADLHYAPLPANVIELVRVRL